MIYSSIGNNARQERINFNLIKKTLQVGDIYLKTYKNKNYFAYFNKKTVEYYTCDLDYFEIEDNKSSWYLITDEELIKEIFNGLWLQDEWK